MIATNEPRPPLHDAKQIMEGITAASQLRLDAFDVRSNPRREVMIERASALKEPRLIDDVKEIETCKRNSHRNRSIKKSVLSFLLGRDQFAGSHKREEQSVARLAAETQFFLPIAINLGFTRLRAR